MSSYREMATEYLDRARTGRVESLDDILRAQLDALVALSCILLDNAEQRANA